MPYTSCMWFRGCVLTDPADANVFINDMLCLHDMPSYVEPTLQESTPMCTNLRVTIINCQAEPMISFSVVNHAIL